LALYSDRTGLSAIPLVLGHLVLPLVLRPKDEGYGLSTGPRGQGQDKCSHAAGPQAWEPALLQGGGGMK